ncbi:MAG: AAA family ATPase [Promethearchaeota archaeon]|jgi:adenylate kinase
MTDSYLILCTGPPGSGRDVFLESIIEYSKNKEKDLHYHHLFDYIQEVSLEEGFRVNKLNILDFYLNSPEKIRRYRNRAIERILEETRTEGGHHIVSTPYLFEWKGEFLPGLTGEDVEKLNPNMFVVVIDDVIKMWSRLKKDPQWKNQQYTLADIARWRRDETKAAYNFAYNFVPPKQLYIVAYRSEKQVLYDLIFEKNKKTIYLSHPVTGAEDIREDVLTLANELSKYYVVFDPLTINDWDVVSKWKQVRDEAHRKGTQIPDEIECIIEEDGVEKYYCDSKEVELAIKDIRRQIVDRDYKIIDSCDYLFVYHPRESISAGVMCEMVHAKGVAKMVYAMYPFEPSPFFEHYANQIFNNKEDFLNFLLEIS